MKLNLILVYCLISTIAIIYLFFDKKDDVLNTHLTASDMILADSSGQRRIIIGTKLPAPYLDGKEYKRETDPSGIVFYDQHGNECGGLALNSFEGNELNALVFDYDKSEAISMFKSEVENESKFHAGIVILDKPAPGQDPQDIQAIQRVIVENNNGNATLALNDKNGNSRIVLLVDTLDNARILIKDKEGNVIKELD